MNCPKCGSANDDSFQFCLRCGNPLKPQSAPASSQPAAGAQSQSTLPSYPSFQQAGPPPQASYPQQPQPVQYISQPPQTGYPQQSYLPQHQHMTTSPVYPGQISSSTMNIWGPFAGFGTRRKHSGWLLDNRGDCSEKLTGQVRALFEERRIPRATITYEVLTAKGLVVENRPYFILRRGLASAGLNITQFGKDLFISLVTYLKPPVSNFRVLIVGMMALFWLFMTFVFPPILQNSISGLIGLNSIFGGYSSEPNIGGLAFALCILGPLGAINSLALGLLIIYSIFKWFTEKDILAGLRTTPNEFDEDDLMAMEKAVEQTVHQAMDDIGLDPDELIPASRQTSTRVI